jgi:GntR family transcriptional repressor for pyruvate dehydrogenase complex
MVTKRMDGDAESGPTGSGEQAGPMPTRLSRPVKISERIAAALVEDIIRDGLVAGDRLSNEAAMVDRFRVGRGSLREALRILEIHGLISLKSGPNGGPVVLDVDPRDVGRTFSLYLSLRGASMSDLVETRLFIEPMVARLAAQNRDPEGLRRLQWALDNEAAIRDGDNRYIDAANDFHYVIAGMTGNPVLDLVATALKELYTTRLVQGGLAKETTEPSIRLEHLEIGKAILEGKPVKAEKLMKEHVGFYMGRLKEVAPTFASSPITWG